MRITERQIRSAIRRIILEAEGDDTGLEMTTAEKAAKAAITPSPVTPPKPPTAEADVSPVEAFTQALARKMRKKGVPESTVTAMLDATKGSP